MTHKELAVDLQDLLVIEVLQLRSHCSVWLQIKENAREELSGLVAGLTSTSAALNCCQLRQSTASALPNAAQQQPDGIIDLTDGSPQNPGKRPRVL